MDGSDLIHSFINAVMIPVVLIFLCIILPPFFIINFILKIFRCFFFHENMEGKVVLITGAASGIGEQMAYEYAKKGACLVIVDKRGDELQNVVERAGELGSPGVLPVCADVSKVDDCKRFVDEAINHFGRLDHLVNNAGIISACRIEDITDVTEAAPMMDINFWGSVYSTHFAIPHLKKTKGKIVVISSASAILHPPRLGFYIASKSALKSFYETLRVELAPQIKITIATPGFIDTDMTRGKKHLEMKAIIKQNPELIRKVVHIFPLMSSRSCAKSIVDSVRRGERYVTEPKWYRVFFMLQTLCPELIEWYYHTFYFTKRRTSHHSHSESESQMIASIPFPSSQTKAD